MNRGVVSVPEPPTIHVEAASDLGRLLDTVAEADLLLEMDGVHFRLYRVAEPTQPSATERGRLAPERVLNIIGLGASAHGSDIARLKDQYVADAADRRE